MPYNNTIFSYINQIHKDSIAVDDDQYKQFKETMERTGLTGKKTMFQATSHIDEKNHCKQDLFSLDTFDP